MCDGDKPPAWCDDEATVLDHIDLNGYFNALFAAIRPSATELERENIMDMVLAPFSAHVIGDFGNEPPDRWATEATNAYVATASFDQVVAFVRRLQDTWVGLTPGVVERLRDYVRHVEGVAPEQRDVLESLLTKRFSKE